MLLDTVELPSGLYWVDEFESYGVAQTFKRTLAGTLAEYHAPLIAGRKINLESQPDMGWASKGVVDQLLNLANAPGEVYSLELRGVTYTVMFDHSNGPGFEATPLMPGGEQGAEAYFQIKIHLITI